MPVPGVTITERDLSVYVPTPSSAGVGLIGAASKGAVNTLFEIATESELVANLGRPADGLHALRAAIRYLQEGNSLKFVRIGGTALAKAKYELNSAAGALILTVTAKTAGTDSNNRIAVSLLHDTGGLTYTLYVREDGRLVETYTAQTNASIESTVNTTSTRIDVSVDTAAGSTLPAQTYNTTRQTQEWRVLVGGNDGNLPTSNTPDSLTGGLSARDSWAESIDAPAAATRTFSFTLTAQPEPGSLTIIVSATDGSATENITFTDKNGSSNVGEGTLYGSTPSSIGTTGITGTVNYETKVVTLDLGDDGSSTDNVSTATAHTVSYKQGTVEDSATTATDQLTYSGYVSRPGVRPDSVEIIVPRLDQLDVGAAASLPASPARKATATIQGSKHVLGTMRITTTDIFGNAMTLTDTDGDGYLTGSTPTTTGVLEELTFAGGTTPNPAPTVGTILSQATSLASGVVREVLSATQYIVDRTTAATFDTSNDVTGTGGVGTSTPGVPGAVPTILNFVNYSTGAVTLYFSANIGIGIPVVAQFSQKIHDTNAGVLSGANLSSGSIDFTTGAYSLTFTLTDSGDYQPNFPSGGAIQFRYGHVTVLGVGDASETVYTGRLKEFPVKPGSVVLSVGASSITDDGSGAFSGALGTGTVNYWTGDISFTFFSAPGSGVEVEVNYDVIKVHFSSKTAGPDHNRQATITDGFYLAWGASPTDATKNRLRVMFNDGSSTTAVETFDLLTDEAHVLAVVNGTGQYTGSNYITAESAGRVGTLNNSTQNIGLAGAFTSAQVAGTIVSGVRTGLKIFEQPDVVKMNWMACPGVHNRAVTLAGLASASSLNRRAIWVVSLPDFLDELDARDFSNGEYNAATAGGVARPTAAVPYPLLSAVNTDRAAFFFPYTRYYDAYSAASVYEPPEGDALANAARIARNRETWYAMAGAVNGLMPTVSDVRVALNNEQNARVYDYDGSTHQVINVIRKFVGEGIMLWGQRTALRAATALNRINVRWTLDVLEDAARVNAKRFNFEPADDALFRKIAKMWKNLLSPIKARRGITNYRVVCDATTNPPAQLANNTVKAQVFIQFTSTAEYIEFEAVVTPLDVDISQVQ